MSEIKAELLQSFNNDLGPVNAAKVSFLKEASVFDTGEHDGSHTRLIRYLAKHKHFTCFTHSRETFVIDLDLTNLDELDLAGMVYSKIAGSKLLKVRHSIYGWANLINSEKLYSEYAYTIHLKLIELYPNVWSELINRKYEYNQPFISDNHSAKHVTKETDQRFIDATFRESVPIAIARHRFKHMIGFTYNEVSRRYVSNVDPEIYSIDEWRSKPAGSIKQGSGGLLTSNKSISKAVKCYHYDNLSLYDYLLSENVAPEQARFVLPQSMMTQYIVTGSLSGLARLCKQRLDNHAQLEIRQLAQQIDEQLTEQYGDIWLNAK